MIELYIMHHDEREMYDENQNMQEMNESMLMINWCVCEHDIQVCIDDVNDKPHVMRNENEKSLEEIDENESGIDELACMRAEYSWHPN